MSTCEFKNRESQDESSRQMDELFLQERMSRIGQKILVLSGKGGVGKSTVAVNLAVAISLSGKKVGLLDVDVHGPSVPKLMGLEGKRLTSDGEGLIPISVGDNLKVMSIGFLLEENRSPVIWRGPAKYHAIRQFLQNVEWGVLDYLVVDCPPGTGDEPLAVAQLIGTGSRAVVVTTPQDVSVSDVRRSITFCQTVSVPVAGIIENMSGFICPDCGKKIDIFKVGGGKALAEEMDVPFLGSIPLDADIVRSGDTGKPFTEHFSHTQTAKAFADIIAPLINNQTNKQKTITNKENFMRIALPMAGGKLCMHFGHCEQFALIDVDPAQKKILKQTTVEPPAHEPGLLPRWLGEKGVNVIIAGGMGQRAQGLFSENGIQVVVGAPADSAENLVASFLDGTLTSGVNVCDH